MVKKCFISIVIAIILTGCSSGLTKQEDNESTYDQVERKQEVESPIDKDVEQGLEKTSENNKTEVNNISPQYRINEVFSVVPIDDANPKVVLLTFDDTPDRYALEMAKTLKELDASAIFFVNGHLLQTQEKEKILQEIASLGFEIGNHTYSHYDLSTLTPEQQKEEIVSVNELVEKILGKRPKFFRAPFGVNTDISRAVAKEENMVLMNWSYGFDWNKEYMDKDALATIMVETELLGNGANLLMHDREWTSAALADIVKGLREKGYEIVDPSLIETIE